MEKKTIRKPRSYKCSESSYLKAVKRAKKQKVSLANVVEWCVDMYGDDSNIVHFEAMLPAIRKNKSPKK